ncbi:MAG TPA: glutamate-1-semialdehyde 2,1-aminomutase [Steroidobacteraceae bacterium]|nr:glutamate-1-semialdehyde 2,1-aminomutase [Steroidobacteraceae bacterium]
MSQSDSLFERAKKVSPGGVHSPVRAFKGVGGTPRFMTGGAGAMLRDVDGRELLDFCMAFGPLILGHGNRGVRDAAVAAIDRGWSLGTAEPYSLALAEFITARIPWVQSIRFVNSGTEAVMSALRVARGATRRDVILKFDGCYHGHADSMLIRSGSGLAEATEPDSAGLNKGVLGGTLVAPLNDEAALEAVFARHGGEIAAAIIEPVPANYGLLPQRPEFLQTLAVLCRKHGALLILDEVITGFRLGFAGAAGQYGIEPDLVTYGKVIGGGFPVGAYGGKRQYMELVAPVGPVYQAGTLSANPVAMAAGLATLEQLADGGAYTQLEKLGVELEQRLAAIPGLTVQRVGSLFWPWLAANAAPLRSLTDMKSRPAAPFGPVFHKLLDAGIYLAPSAFEVSFLSTAHNSAHVEQLAKELHAALAFADQR